MNVPTTDFAALSPAVSVFRRKRPLVLLATDQRRAAPPGLFDPHGLLLRLVHELPESVLTSVAFAIILPSLF